jgi:ABC-type transport system involved in multi-copper enzyme maturation permease subunit
VNAARQAWAVARMELRRGVSWRSLWVILMAFAPVVIIAAHALEDHTHRLEEETLILNGIVQIYYVRFGIFFGCLGIFLRLVRGEVAERTLHYLFLAPLRREALLVGKFLAGVLTTVLVFGTSVTASVLLVYGHFGEGRMVLAHGPALAHLRLDLLVVVLACLGYGAVFLAFSLLFKNPVVPAVILVFWEGVNGALPAWLKHLSVTFYLKPLFPVELPMKGVLSLFTVVAEPTPRWLAVTGLFVFTALVVAFACWRMKRMEVSYSSD